MVRFLLRRLVLSISISLLVSGCSYKFVKGGGVSVFIMPIQNSTLMPQLDILLTEEIKNTFNKNPGFNLVYSKEQADISINIDVKKLVRRPLFYSKGDISEVVSGRFSVEAEVAIYKRGEEVSKDTIKESLAFPLSVIYKEEDMLKNISEKFAKKIYFWLLDKYEKE